MQALQRFQHATGLVPIDEKPVVLILIAAAAGAFRTPHPTLVATIYAASVVYGFLISYNKYRGRLADVANRYEHRGIDPDEYRSMRRPLAGAERRRWVERCLWLSGFVGVGLPAVVGELRQSILAASAIVVYLALFENRNAKRRYWWMKVLSVVGATGLATAGFLTSVEHDAARFVAILAVVLVWRTGFDAALDIIDAEADTVNRIPTVATRFGGLATMRAIAVLVTSLGLGMTAWTFGRSLGPAAGTAAAVILALGVTCIVATAAWPDGRSIDVLFRSLQASLGIGLAAVAFSWHGASAAGAVLAVTALEGANAIHRRRPYFWLVIRRQRPASDTNKAVIG